MLIRAETESDVAGIDRVLSEAFARPERDASPPEVGLVRRLRVSKAWVPQQSLVAHVDDVLVAHCLCTRAGVGGVGCLALGPIGVLPSRQGVGIGSALVHSAIDTAEDMGEPLIGLLGDARYYSRFGFVAGTSIGIEPPDPAWGSSFQVLRLAAYRQVTGVFDYPRPFMESG